MRTYTTPTVVIDVPDGAQALADAERVIVAAKGRQLIEKDVASVDGTAVAVPYTQAETAALGAGLVEFEVTLKMPDGTVVKTETAAARLKEAVLRREV